ncbi:MULTISPECIES: alpha/beta hydrolase [Rhodanobacter]|uniref:alpha/beta hydrolase n=1 Tax=Rhodanobacter TaxID=75309 RepID=UPI000260EED2|nr:MULTISPECIES: alpha/beta hydrolase-fold protein [Rhodanobacter]EIM01853.1 esterase [Rhodanobacter denitrificans]KZC18846.1 esterase [Rhodanobacter denitrificans]UJJ50263.1 esterase family protein [Rhodanobacter denitrificans]UJJ57546.1 esterase family protein [Rhodanobacter denitrificans]UJM91417.1 esterase family protein [Rhodanobacter denitrificans]
MAPRRRPLVSWWLLGVLLLAGCAPALAADAVAGDEPVQLQFDAPAFAPQRIKVAVYLPPGYARASGRRYPVLYANDGQDMTAVGLQPTLAQLYRDQAIEPLIVVAIRMLDDRASGYGLSDRAAARSLVGGSRIGPIGMRAQDYSAWVATALVPYVDTHYRTRRSARGRTMLGWSLGALNAFNLGWQYPEVFGQVGAFSPSFWLAADRSSATAIQHTRLAQAMVDHGPGRAGLKFWFAAGTTEETADRDGDGINDTVDDVQDLLEGYRGADGFRARGLKQLGYSINLDYAGHPSRRADASLFLLPGGQHNQASWKRMLPPFLRWAYARPRQKPL